MKEFNEFIQNRKPLQRVMDNLNESDGIMLESMFYEFAKHQTIKEHNKEVSIMDINDILVAACRIEFQVALINQGKTEVNETGINRLDVIKEKASLIRIIGKRLLLLLQLIK